MKNYHYKAFFFDFDGVLVDSVEIKTKAFTLLFQDHGEKISALIADHHRRNGGMPRAEKFEYYYRHFLGESLAPDRLLELSRRFSTLVMKELLLAPEIPGVTPFLKRCQGNLPCFIVSAAPVVEILEIVKHRKWNDLFLAVKGSPVSKKENLKSLLEEYRLDPEKTLFFGDAYSDFRAALDCGVDFIGILPGPEAPLLKAAPDIEWHRDFIEAAARVLKV